MTKKTIPTNCLNCGREFQIQPHVVKHNRGKFCSTYCKYNYAHVHGMTKFKVNCERCGKEFWTTPSKRAEGKGKYCSRECFNPPTYSVCQNCGKTFRHSPSAQPAYCSKDCTDTDAGFRERRRQSTITAWQNEETRQRLMAGIEARSQSEEWLSAPHFQKGEAHPRYKGNKRNRSEASRYQYKKWKSDVLKRDNYTCQVCGQRGGWLEAHHLKEWAEFPELRYEISNGMAVCEDCHIRLHGRKRHPRTRTCQNCGGDFRPKRSYAKYCNWDCFVASRRK